MTLQELVTAARQRLIDAGIPSDEAALDARLLAQEILGWDAARFLTEAGGTPPASFESRFAPMVARRVAREPLAYIVGRREFWNLTFDVSPGVLVPRPETEIVVEAVLELFPDPHMPLMVCDIGTGSGCLAVAIARERPGAHVVATDISPSALSIARRNVTRHHLAERVQLLEADLLGDDAAPFDLIVSNPPYVPEGARATMSPEVSAYEPHQALFGGPDGLAVVRRLLAAAPARLKAGGWLVFEMGVHQAEAVRALIRATDGLTMTEVRRDLQGIPRTVLVQRT